MNSLFFYYDNKTRKFIGTLSIAFIIGLYAIKGLPSFAGKSISEILPILLTSITVTGVKVGIICGVIVIGKKIAKYIYNNNLTFEEYFNLYLNQ